MRCRDRFVESARDLIGMPLNLAGAGTPPLFFLDVCDESLITFDSTVGLYVQGAIAERIALCGHSVITQRCHWVTMPSP